MGEFLVGHFSFTCSIFLSLIKNWSATAMWIYYWGHYSPLTHNWMVHTTLFSSQATQSVCDRRKRANAGLIDPWITQNLFSPLLYCKPINHLLFFLFFILKTTLLSLSWLHVMDAVLKHQAKHKITSLVIIHNLFLHKFGTAMGRGGRDT